jgi:membrane protein
MTRAKKPNPPKNFAMLCVRAGRGLIGNYGTETSGYLTFLSLLSLFPYLVLMISLAGIFGQREHGRELIALLLQHLPPDSIATIQPRITEITSGPPHGLLTFSILGALWTSSSAVEALRKALNRAYRVGEQRTYIGQRIVAILQVLVFTLLILLVMLALVFTPIVLNSFTDYTGLAIPLKLEHFLSHYFIYFGAGALFLLVASFYYVLPNVYQRPVRVVPGALLVVGLWIGGASLVTLYLHKMSQLTLIYGSLSGFIATLIFFYVMILIFLYGAEFNYQLLLGAGDIVEKEVPRGKTLH